jgi:hypothetical protein
MTKTSKDMDAIHAEALEQDETRAAIISETHRRLGVMVRAAEVVKVCENGYVITRGMLDDEIAETERASSALRPAYECGAPMILGVNASINMFA